MGREGGWVGGEVRWVGREWVGKWGGSGWVGEWGGRG